MTDLAAHKRASVTLLNRLAQGDLDVLHPQAEAFAMHPLGHITGTAVADLWRALRSALPDGERRDTMVLCGENHPDPRVTTPRHSPLVACLGSYQGTFRTPLLDIPATNGVVHLNYGEAHQIEDGRIRRSWLHWDLSDLMMQARVWPLGPSVGTPHMWPGAKNGLGMALDHCDPETGARRMTQVLAMHESIGKFDGKTVTSVPMDPHWAPNFMYYAGGGIGACRGVSGFREHHQIPFVRGFNDRKGAGHFIRVGDGDCAVTGGNVVGTHTGEWLGLPSTGKTIKIPVMDFYAFEGDLITENWLPIDVPGIAAQMGVDVFQRMRHLAGHPRSDL